MTDPLTRRNFLRALAASVVAAGCPLPVGATKETMWFVYDPATRWDLYREDSSRAYWALLNSWIEVSQPSDWRIAA